MISLMNLTVDMIIEGLKLHDIKFKRRLCRDLCEINIAHFLFVWIFFGLEQGFSAFFLPFAPCQFPNVQFTPCFCLLTSAVEKCTTASLNLPPG